MNRREPAIEIVVGKKGVGKTYLTRQQIDGYVLNDSKTAWKGRPVLVLDTTGEYSDFKTIAFDVEEKNELIRAKNVIKIQLPYKYRILTIKKNRQPYTVKETLIAVSTLAKYFRNGLLILEDINKYIVQHIKIDVVGLLVSVRHLGVDLILHYQAARKVPPTMWQNCNFLRMHKQIEPLDIFRDRVPNFEIIKLAEIIVDKRYNSGDEYYCCWVAIEDSYLLNVDEDDFVKACEEYFYSYPAMVKKFTRGKNKTQDESLKAFIEAKLSYLKTN